MVKISRAFSLLKSGGRREWRARRWDARADRAAERKRFWINQWHSLEYMFRGDQAENARVAAMEFSQIECMARRRAQEIREGR